MVMVICEERKHCLDGFVGFGDRWDWKGNTTEIESKAFDHEISPIMQCDCDNCKPCYLQP